jgi:hypothetical protein
MIRHLAFVAPALVLLFITPGSHAAPIVYLASLSGPAESPPNTSPATGNSEVDYDPTAHTLHVHVTFSGLTAGTTASHIHSPTLIPFTGATGVATTTPTFPDFPSGVTSGTYDRTLDLTSLLSYNPSFVSANGGTAASAEMALALGLSVGEAYLNIHTTNFPGGEIRGFLVVPEPTSVVMLTTGVFGVLVYGWWTKGRRRK